MADISLTRKHALGRDGARAAAEKMADKLGEKFDLTGNWRGDTLHFSRPGVNGTLAVSATELVLEVTLGFLLKAMKGPIERSVHEQLDKVLASAKPAAAPKAVAPKTPAKAAPAPTARKPAAKKK